MRPDSTRVRSKGTAYPRRNIAPLAEEGEMGERRDEDPPLESTRLEPSKNSLARTRIYLGAGVRSPPTSYGAAGGGNTRSRLVWKGERGLYRAEPFF